MNKRLLLSLGGIALVSSSFFLPLVMGPPAVTMTDAVLGPIPQLYMPFVIVTYFVGVFSVIISSMPKRIPVISSRFIGIIMGILAVLSSLIVYKLLTGTFGLGLYAWISGNIFFLLGSFFRLPRTKQNGNEGTTS